MVFTSTSFSAFSLSTSPVCTGIHKHISFYTPLSPLSLNTRTREFWILPSKKTKHVAHNFSQLVAQVECALQEKGGNSGDSVPLTEYEEGEGVVILGEYPITVNTLSLPPYWYHLSFTFYTRELLWFFFFFVDWKTFLLHIFHKRGFAFCVTYEYFWKEHFHENLRLKVRRDSRKIPPSPSLFWH